MKINHYNTIQSNMEKEKYVPFDPNYKKFKHVISLTSYIHQHIGNIKVTERIYNKGDCKLYSHIFSHSINIIPYKINFNKY